MNLTRPPRSGWLSALVTCCVVALTGCPSNGGDGEPGSGVSGRITYDWLNANSAAEGGVRLDYGGKQARPARRILVEARVAGGQVLTTTTDDDGRFAFPQIEDGAQVNVRAVAALKANAYQPDGVGLETCNGASWDVEVVDNTEGQALWALEREEIKAPTPNANLHAETTHNGSDYVARAGAPFAIADTFVTEIEKICEGDAALVLPHLFANWSPQNRAVGGSPATGAIGTSYYTSGASGNAPNLFILGDEDADTDEYDDHVVAHEFGHFLEDQLYRSDSVGGPHGMGDVLDPRVAFGEGYGNALSAMTFDDPIYVDTNGANQGRGFQLNIDRAPDANDRGVYSEGSAQHVLWRLYEARDGEANSGRFDRIHDILRNRQRPSEALTSLHSFSAYYNEVYGDADGLRALWDDTIATDFDALCAGACSGSGDAADLWDTDNDIGQQYAPTRQYLATVRDAQFWRLYKTLSGTGFAAPGDGHDVTVGSGEAHNRFGAQRWYRYTGTGDAVTVRVNLSSISLCNSDVTDLDLFLRGIIDSNIATDGCPTLGVPGQVDQTYVLVVNSFGEDAPNGFGISVE